MLANLSFEEWAQMPFPSTNVRVTLGGELFDGGVKWVHNHAQMLC
jgi:hypothetical protein